MADQNEDIDIEFQKLNQNWAINKTNILYSPLSADFLVLEMWESIYDIFLITHVTFEIMYLANAACLLLHWYNLSKLFEKQINL